MKFNFSKEWCEQAAKTEASIGVAAFNPNIFKENTMKYEFSIFLYRKNIEGY